MKYKFEVTFTDGSTEIIEAQDYVIQEGALFFVNPSEGKIPPETCFNFSNVLKIRRM